MDSGTLMQVEEFFDPAGCTVSYIVFDRATRQCAVIDSVLGFDPKSGRTSTAGADRLVARVRALYAKVQWILETHAHADHLSAAPYLKQQVGGRIGIGEHIREVQVAFGALVNASDDFTRDDLHATVASSTTCCATTKCSASAT